MTHSQRLLTVAAAAAIAAAGLVASAQTGAFNGPPPRLIPYAGYLEHDGAPADGSYSMTFELFDAESGGSALFTETQSVTASNGRFSVALGSTTEGGIDETVTTLFASSELWLQIGVEGMTLTGRQRLLAAPYALNADKAKRADSFVVTGALTAQSVSAATSVSAASVSATSVSAASVSASSNVMAKRLRSTDMGDATTNPASGSLWVDDGTGNQLWLDGNEILTTGNMFLDPDGDGASIDTGTLYVRGGLSVSGGLSVGGAFLGTDEVTATNVNRRPSLGASAQRICFLSQFRTYDNESEGSVERCTVVNDGTNWYLEWEGRNNSELVCMARCLTW